MQKRLGGTMDKSSMSQQRILTAMKANRKLTGWAALARQLQPAD